jgi:hypothetical protein
MENSAKTERQLEPIVKGFANHRRIQMMGLLETHPDLSLSEVCSILRIGVKTGCEHLRRLAFAGLVLKRYEGRRVRHRLTTRALDILTFLRKLE